MSPYRFIYQDESGDVGRGQEHFVVGLLLVREREPLWAAIREVRNCHHYANELHFEKMSDLRCRVYADVLSAVAKHAGLFGFEALAVPRAAFERCFAPHQRHLAYNYFTKLLLEAKGTDLDEAVMFADAKSRIKEDNFLEYLVLEMNLGVPFRQGREMRKVLKKVEPLDSKLDDLLQVADLLTGCVNNALGHPAGSRKRQTRLHAERLGLISPESVWVWKPQTKTPRALRS